MNKTSKFTNWCYSCTLQKSFVWFWSLLLFVSPFRDIVISCCFRKQSIEQPKKQQKKTINYVKTKWHFRICNLHISSPYVSSLSQWSRLDDAIDMISSSDDELDTLSTAFLIGRPASLVSSACFCGFADDFWTIFDILCTFFCWWVSIKHTNMTAGQQQENGSLVLTRAVFFLLSMSHLYCLYCMACKYYIHLQSINKQWDGGSLFFYYYY